MAETSLPNHPAFPYLLYKNAAKLFEKPWYQLEEEEKMRVRREAEEESAVQQAILTSEEAVAVSLEAAVVDEAVATISKRFADAVDFERELKRNGLDEKSLRLGLTDELKAEGVLAKIAGRADEPSEEEVGSFYRQHRGRFVSPETRKARHILVTINDDFRENTRSEAAKRISRIMDELLPAPEKFTEYAQKYSECPSAIRGGDLGPVPRGKLLAGLEEALFTLEQGEVSDILESELGFHLLLCEEIQPRRELDLEAAAPLIRDHLRRRNRESCQGKWLQMLMNERS